MCCCIESFCSCQQINPTFGFDFLSSCELFGSENRVLLCFIIKVRFKKTINSKESLIYYFKNNLDMCLIDCAVQVIQLSFSPLKLNTCFEVKKQRKINVK